MSQGRGFQLHNSPHPQGVVNCPCPRLGQGPCQYGVQQINFFAHFWKSFAHFSNILPSWGPNCPDCSSFCPLSISGQEKGCFGVSLWVFCVHTYPREGCVTAESRTGVCDGILGKMRLHLGKMRPFWAISRKIGQKCCRIGKEEFNHGCPLRQR